MHTLLPEPALNSNYGIYNLFVDAEDDNVDKKKLSNSILLKNFAIIHRSQSYPQLNIKEESGIFRRMQLNDFMLLRELRKKMRFQIYPA